MLQVSRASAQRLASLCLAEGLIAFRLEHPIAACMELAARLVACKYRGVLRYSSQGFMN
jgi:DNA-binding transcriptional regulator LsrR (DeoR family)